MRLRSRREQTVWIEGAGLELRLAAGEDIRTEISTKFTPARVTAELAAAGLEVEAIWTDAGGRFALSRSAPR
jgi:L-histidine Nalpha-methyltransferase